MFYIVLPIKNESVDTPALFSINKLNIASFYTKDHGERDGSSLRSWVTKQCTTHSIDISDDDRVLLICHPRLFGYAFNPISYWLIYEKNQYLKAVICEVNNTFGDNHSYILSKEDASAIEKDHIFTAKKNLYVSPFNSVKNGSYEFTFNVNQTSFHSAINYFEDETQVLNTYMGGTRHLMNNWSIIKSVLWYPFMTFLVVYRIHYHAVRIRLKGVRSTLKNRPGPTSGKSTKGS